MKQVLTTCPYCGTGCTFYLNVEGDQVVGVTPNDDPRSVNQGILCLKGHFGYDFIDRQKRLTTPLIRKNGELVEASWDEAIHLVASKMKETIRDYGPDALAAFSSARCTNEENYLMQKLMRAVVGTNNVDHCARL
ncbi:formate dehydrogenase-like protein [Symbiobacterium thermophilum IAM 14863]|uniref:Formate dehydrogenase-like protein n=2 Tax=Symbiobacterium thermophilum TaxID=2734 RepID=Q67J73_SYMTH|nr:formate dehydrogenase-like protein [Symbiobacterium thermophilum IAM 14863]